MATLTAEKEQDRQDAAEEQERLNGEIGEREDELQQIQIQLEDAAGLAQLVKQQAAGQQLMRHPLADTDWQFVQHRLRQPLADNL